MRVILTVAPWPVRAIVLALLMLTACDPAPRTSETTSTGCLFQGYGSGVFYFNCASDFGPALAEFRKTHQVLSITSYSSYSYGTSGYWVVTQ